MIWQPKLSSWQTVIADLSLILFLTSAFALDNDSAATPDQPGSEQAQEDFAGIPLSVWRDGKDSIPFKLWIAEQLPDEAVSPTVTVRYRPGGLANAWRRTGEIREALSSTGMEAHILFMPGRLDSVEIQMRHDLASTDAPADFGPDIASLQPPNRDN